MSCVGGRQCNDNPIVDKPRVQDMSQFVCVLHCCARPELCGEAAHDRSDLLMIIGDYDSPVAKQIRILHLDGGGIACPVCKPSCQSPWGSSEIHKS